MYLISWHLLHLNLMAEKMRSGTKISLYDIYIDVTDDMENISLKAKFHSLPSCTVMMCDLTRYLLVKERLHTLQVKGRGGSGPTEVSLCRSAVKLSACARNWSDMSLSDGNQGELEGGRKGSVTERIGSIHIFLYLPTNSKYRERHL